MHGDVKLCVQIHVGYVKMLASRFLTNHFVYKLPLFFFFWCV